MAHLGLFREMVSSVAARRAGRCAVAALAQESDVPYAPDSDGPGPTFESKRINDVYPGSHSSLRRINFKDFTFIDFDEHGQLRDRYPLKNGHYQERYDDAYEEMNFIGVRYLSKPNTAGAEYALVL